MAKILFRGFKGEIPRLEPHLLPDVNAQLAVDCEFDSGALTPIKDGFELATMANNPAKGVYTEDGLLFYSWPVETIAFPSPLAEDSFNRIYYLSPSEGLLKVVTKAGMTGNGPTPTGAVRAGVPNPTTKPTLSLRDRSTLPDYPSVAISAESWWVDIANGNIVNRAAAIVTPLIALRAYQVAKPSTFGAPAARRMASKLTFTDVDTGKEIFSLTASSGVITKSQSVPGTVEGLFQEDATRGIWYLTWGVMETRAYTYTYENTWNEEGAAAPPDTISPTYVQDVQIDVTPGDFTNFRPFLKYNIYRTYGNVATYIKTLATVDGSVSTRFYDFSSKPSTVSNALESSDYLPPSIGLSCFEMMPNGWAAIAKDNTVWLSAPGMMHAWPHSQTFRSTVRGLRATQQALIVTTADGVYYIGGNVPSAANQTKIALPQPGIAQRSMVLMDGAVVYASNDGIAMIAGGQGNMNVSEKLFFRKKWREIYDVVLRDASLMFGYHDGILIAQSNTTPIGFAVRLDDDAGAFTRNSRRYDAMMQLPVTDTLYYTIGSKLYQFRGANTNLPFDWWSKDFVFPKDTVFGAGYILCEGPITLRLYADVKVGSEIVQQLVHTATLTDGHFRLPDLNLSRKWSVRLSGTSKITEFAMARSMKELQSV